MGLATTGGGALLEISIVVAGYFDCGDGKESCFLLRLEFTFEVAIKIRACLEFSWVTKSRAGEVDFCNLDSSC